MSRQKKALRPQTKHQAISREQLKEKTVKKTQGSPMLIWLMMLLGFLPLMFTIDVMDTAMTLRYPLLSGFILLFVTYFYGFRKKLLISAWPSVVKICFSLGIIYGLWNLIGLFSAINEEQVYYGLARHFLTMIFLYMVTQIAIAEESYLVQLCRLLSVTAIIHSVVGIGQFYGSAFLNIPGNFPPYGLMSNRNLFGSAQVLLLPFAIFTLYKGGNFWRSVGGLAIAGIIVSAVLSQTRASWLAGLAIVGVSLALVIIFSPVNRKKWIIGSLSGVAAIALIVFLLTAADSEGNLSTSLRERTSTEIGTDTATHTASGNVSERLKIWRKTITLVKDYPFTGVGLGNWKVVLPKYGSEGLAWAKGFYVPDRPHNDYLLLAAESGIPGALMYIGMFGVIALLAMKTIIRPGNEDRRMLNILMLAGLAAYAIDCMVSFPTERIEHSLYVFLMAGIIIGTYTNSAAPAANRQPLNKLLLGIFILVAAFNLLLGIKRYKFEKKIVLSKHYQSVGMPQMSIDEGNKGKSSLISLDPNGFPMETFIALSFKDQKKYPEALAEMDKAIAHHPYNKALLINKGTIYTAMLKFDSAIIYYNQALKLTPEFPTIFFNLAINYYHLGNYAACLDALNKVDLTGNNEFLALKQEVTSRLAAQNTPVIK